MRLTAYKALAVCLGKRIPSASPGQVPQFPLQAEHLVGVGEDHTPRFRRCQAASILAEELGTDLTLQLCQLPADSLGRQVQDLPGAADGTVGRDRPEVPQMFQVQVSHRRRLRQCHR